MKTLYTTLLLLLPVLCIAQGKKISRTEDKKKGTVTYKSPRMKHITAIREFKTDEFFGLLIYLEHDRELGNPNGITITFSDGTTYQEESRLDCRSAGAIFGGNGYGNSSTESFGYNVQGFIHITPDNFEKFTTRRIAKVQLNEASALISEKEGEKTKTFIKRLADAKREATSPK